jgi:hypothetical protein
MSTKSKTKPPGQSWITGTSSAMSLCQTINGPGKLRSHGDCSLTPTTAATLHGPQEKPNGLKHFSETFFLEENR